MTTEINQQETAGLPGAAATMIEGSAKDLGQLLGVPVDFTLATVAENGPNTPDDIDNGVHLSAEFAGAVTGDSWLIVTAEDAKSIVRMMPQGKDVAEENLLGEVGMSALSEAMTQLTIGAATALSNGLGESVDISPPSLCPALEIPAKPDDAIVVTFEGEIAGATGIRIYWQIDHDLAENLGAGWLAATGTPTATSPQQQAPTVATSAQAAPGAQPSPTGGVINAVELDVAVELGNVAMTIGELLRMGEGSVVTLTQTVGDNVVMLANGTPVASGEVVVVDGTLGFRVADLITEAKGA